MGYSGVQPAHLHRCERRCIKYRKADSFSHMLVIHLRERRSNRWNLSDGGLVEDRASIPSLAAIPSVESGTKIATVDGTVLESQEPL